MKILISYFYQIRFFKSNYIPISTAVWPPKYFFHNGQQFKDKNGVWNGIQAFEFMPDESCEGLCQGPQNCMKKEENCAFLSTYKAQLDKLDFNSIMERFKILGNKVKEVENFEEEPICVLIVFETPTNPCSERGPLKKWFAEHGYELEEFRKELI